MQKKGSKTHKKQSDEAYLKVYEAHLYPEYDSMEQVKRDVHRLMKRENISMEQLLNEIPDQYAKGGEVKSSFHKFAERILKDSQFGRTNSMAKNEFKHNRLDKKAVIGKKSVTISSYTPNTKRYLDSQTFNNLKELDEYLYKNQIYAKGGEIVEPMIYVASLTDYNNGKLVGEFFKFSDYNDEDELLDGITDYLEGLTEKFDDGEIREEFAIHDYEGFPREYYSEYMGLEDFKQIYDFIRISEEIDLPMEIIMERASDTGYEDPDDIINDYDDYYEQSIDGDDPSDYVYELESAGVLGIEFFDNHIYITPTDLRLLYSENVDRYFEDLQYDNPDEDEDELYKQAEEMADDEQDRMENDLAGYLSDLGYDSIPNWVSKDYESAWNDLSYDYTTYYDSENDTTHIFRN